MNVEEEREARREFVDVQAALDGPLHVLQTIGNRERELLRGGRAGFANVIAADADAVPARHLFCAKLDRVGDDAHRRTRRHDPGVLGDELFEAIVLDRAADLVARDSALVGQGDVEAEQHRSGAVDRHRRGDLVERDLVEKDLHVAKRVDRHANHADLAERTWRVTVVSHQGREIEGGRQPGLPLIEQIPKTLVGLPGRSEAREHSHRPEAAPVHGRLNPARVGKLTGKAELTLIAVVEVGRGQKVGHLQVAVRDEALLAQCLAGNRGLHSLGAPLRCSFTQALLWSSDGNSAASFSAGSAVMAGSC